MVSIENLKYLKNKTIFKQAYKDLRSRSEEAWFGENNPLKIGLVSYMEQLKVVYEDKVVNGKLDEKKFVESISHIITKMEDLIASETNVKKCQIGILPVVNAFCYGMSWDTQLIGKSIEAKKLRLDLTDIVETKNGFRFKNKDKKYFIFSLGLLFFHPSNAFTAEEVAAIMLHEIGHGFQHMLLGINVDMGYSAIHNQITSSYMNLKLSELSHRFLISILTLTLPIDVIIYIILYPIFLGIAIYKKISLPVAKEEVEKFGEKILDSFKKHNTIDREKLGEKIKDESKGNIKQSAKYKKRPILESIYKMFYGINLLFKTILAPFNFILDTGANIFLLSNLKLLRKNKMYEEFADSFATYYGLGSSLSTALKKLGNMSEKMDLGALNFLNYVPLVNLVMGGIHYSETKISALIYGYPIHKVRMANVYKNLEYELANNKDLSEKDKNDIKKQMKETEQTFNEYVYGSGAKNFVYKIFNTIIKSSIQKTADSSTIMENVIKVMKENKEKLKELKK